MSFELKTAVLNLELFIARRLLRGKREGAVSVPIVKIAVAGIALGICVMLLSVFIIGGFKQEITEKLAGFTAHLDVTSYDNNDAYTGGSIVATDTLLGILRDIRGVKQAAPYVTKPAILKSPSEIHGVILKGVDSLYDASFYGRHLQSGTLPRLDGRHASAEILLSASVANLLGLRAGDKLTAHFVQDPPRTRLFTVQGIYDTGFREYDDLFVLCDIRQLQRLNGWAPEEVSGIAVELRDLETLPEAGAQLDELLPLDTRNRFLRISTLHDTAPQIFDWLSLLNMNVAVILTLIIVVAGFNMVSGLLILILDKTALIGILKALGCRDASLKRLFLYLALGLILRGMLLGNLLAFLLAAVQALFHPIALNPASYYMDTVPVRFDLWAALFLNIGVFAVSVLMLIIPTVLISKIRPIKAIRFE